MSILLIRHGETDSNVARIVQTPETPLNPRGIGQAKLLAARLAAEPIVQILSSNLERAAMTAMSLGQATGVEVEFEPGLCERSFGELRGRAYVSIGTDIMAPGYQPPGGEDWPLFHRRVADTWAMIAARSQHLNGVLAVVTHGLVCYSLALNHLRLPSDEVIPLRWGNTAVTTIAAGPPWRVTLLNDTSHLDDEHHDSAV